MKNTFFLIIVTILTVIPFSGCQTVHSDNLFLSKYDSKTLEIVLTNRAKSLSAPVSDKYQPIFIYSSNAGQIVFRVNGTLTKTKDGSVKIITVAHAFPKERKEVFYYETLPEKESRFDQGIVSVVRQNNDDIVIVDTGKPQQLEGIYTSPVGAEKPSKMSVVMDTQNYITSLLDGEKYSLLLVSVLSPDGKQKSEFAIGKQSYPGESGTGFVDTHGNLFVLNSGISPNNGVALSFVQMAGLPE